MIWNEGFSSQFYATYVDPVTWRDTEQFDIIEGTITRSESGDALDMTCRSYDPNTERWVRVYLIAKQGDSSVHEALFTGLATSPETNINGNIKEHPLQCFSVLKPAEDIFLERGWYAPAGASGAQIIAQLLSVCPCPVETEDVSPFLSQSIVAEENETNLSMTQKILEAIGWRLRIKGDGTVQVMPQAESPIVTFDVIENDSIEPSLSYTHDWFSCPNCFRAFNGNQSGVARDDDPASPLSTVSRGREVWMQESSAELSNDESIAEYAQRKLAEAQANYIKVNYSRRYMPDLLVGDLVQLHYPAQGIDGVYKVESQTVTLGYGAKTDEEVSNGISR